MSFWRREGIAESWFGGVGIRGGGGVEDGMGMDIVGGGGCAERDGEAGGVMGIPMEMIPLLCQLTIEEESMNCVRSKEFGLTSAHFHRNIR